MIHENENLNFRFTFDASSFKSSFTWMSIGMRFNNLFDGRKLWRQRTSSKMSRRKSFSKKKTSQTKVKTIKCWLEKVFYLVFSCLPSDQSSSTSPESQSTNLNSEWKASLCYEESDVGMMSTAEKAYSWTMIIFAIVVLIIGKIINKRFHR